MADLDKAQTVLIIILVIRSLWQGRRIRQLLEKDQKVAALSRALVKFFGESYPKRQQAIDDRLHKHEQGLQAHAGAISGMTKLIVEDKRDQR